MSNHQPKFKVEVNGRDMRLRIYGGVNGPRMPRCAWSPWVERKHDTVLTAVKGCIAASDLPTAAVESINGVSCWLATYLG